MVPNTVPTSGPLPPLGAARDPWYSPSGPPPASAGVEGALFGLGRLASLAAPPATRLPPAPADQRVDFSLDASWTRGGRAFNKPALQPDRMASEGAPPLAELDFFVGALTRPR